MNIVSIFKKLFTPSSNSSYEDGRNDLELVNALVEQEKLEMDVPMDLYIPQKEEELQAVQTPTEQNVIVHEDIENVSKTSLLDNGNYMAIADALSSLMEEIEDVDGISSTELADVVKSRLQEGFLISGAELISEDKEFNAIRHIPVPAAMVKQGTLIEKIIEPGIMIDNKVIRKAKVIIKK